MRSVGSGKGGRRRAPTDKGSNGPASLRFSVPTWLSNPLRRFITMPVVRLGAGQTWLFHRQLRQSGRVGAATPARLCSLSSGKAATPHEPVGTPPVQLRVCPTTTRNLFPRRSGDDQLLASSPCASDEFSRSLFALAVRLTFCGDIGGALRNASASFSSSMSPSRS